jgi:hypothetical protein
VTEILDLAFERLEGDGIAQSLCCFGSASAIIHVSGGEPTTLGKMYRAS